MTERLGGARALVVGASSGIGRAIGLALAREGARVAFAARRAELLEDAARKAGGGAVAIPCDVREPESCEEVVSRAVASFGGLDALVYAAGVYPWIKLRDLDAEAWRWVIETNLLGASLVTRAAIPHLERGPGCAVYLSSIAASLTPPWPGLGAYVVSKAGLDKLVDAWRGEHPSVGFTSVVVGNTTSNLANPEGTAPSEPPVAGDPAVIQEIMGRWMQKGYLSGEGMHPDGVAEQVVNVIASRERVWNVTVLGHGWSTG